MIADSAMLRVHYSATQRSGVRLLSTCLIITVWGAFDDIHVVFRISEIIEEIPLYTYIVNRYPHTTTDPTFRTHAICCLWLVNIMWLVAPIVTVVWAYQELTDIKPKTL